MPFVVLMMLLGVSIVAADGWGGRAATIIVLMVAAAKVALVVSEYVEVRYAARWLMIIWVVWGSAVFIGLIALLALS
ncbi:MAG: hypothetical protein J2P18_11045 [Nocardia sp.]|nr:hypothetical protein [Nocardia sp.]